MRIALEKTFLGILRIVTGLLNIVLGLGALAVLAAHGFEGSKEAAAYPDFVALAGAVKAWEAVPLAAIRSRIPTVYGGYDIAPWLFLAVLVVPWGILLAQLSRIKYHAWRLDHEQKVREQSKVLEAERRERAIAQKESIARLEREALARSDRETARRARRQAEAEAERREVERVKAEEARRIEAEARREAELERRAAETRREIEEAAPRVPLPRPVPDGLAQAQAGGASKERSRDELLELMAQAKKQLELQKKSLSFLSIDVVDSTGMKVGEDPAIATRDFKHYRKLVEKAIADNRGLKAAWTPDGVMICFPTAEAAVGAAKQVIRDLEDFNRDVKAMRRDFKVRCGINTGTVLFDDAVPMEEMSDRSIDIAGHMQKYAETNTIFIGKHCIEELRAAAGFEPLAKQVDGCDVYAWRSN